MGRSEWAIRVSSNEDIKRVMRFIEDHNSSPDSGEELELVCLLRFDNKIWACLVNHGGRNNTNAFLYDWFPNCTEIYWPFRKPVGWNDCADYVWSHSTQTVPFIF